MFIWMKRVSRLFITLVILGGCKGQMSVDSTGRNPPTDPTDPIAKAVSLAQLPGSWIRTNDNKVLTIFTTGVFQATFCGYSGKITNVTPAASCAPGVWTCGTVTMNFAAGTGSTGCFNPGVAGCSYSKSGYQLILNCGGAFGTETFKAYP